MTATANPQTTIDEHVVEDADLEAALEARETAKTEKAAASATFREADEAAKTRIREFELGDTPARCGRFVIAESDVAARSVAFEAAATKRLTISVAQELF